MIRLRRSSYARPPMKLRNTAVCFSVAILLTVKKMFTRSTYPVRESVSGLNSLTSPRKEVDIVDLQPRRQCSVLIVH